MQERERDFGGEVALEQQAPVRGRLTPEEESALWHNYDFRARARIIEAYQPLVFHIFGKLGLRLGEEAVDLISEGTVGLIQAVDNFRPAPRRALQELRLPAR
jgi:DNA-directed RNA polymerase specialized sigma subunit